MSHEYCVKEAEIAEMKTEVRNLKKVIFSNGGPGLADTVPRLAQSVETFSDNVKCLTTGVNGLLRFQQTIEGERIGREQIRKRNRWVIGLLITATGVLTGGGIYLIKLIIELMGKL